MRPQATARRQQRRVPDASGDPQAFEGLVKLVVMSERDAFEGCQELIAERHGKNLIT